MFITTISIAMVIDTPKTKKRKANYDMDGLFCSAARKDPE